MPLCLLMIYSFTFSVIEDVIEQIWTAYFYNFSENFTACSVSIRTFTEITVNFLGLKQTSLVVMSLFGFKEVLMGYKQGHKILPFF